MPDMHGGHVDHACDLVRAKAQVIVFEIQEITWVETIQTLEHVGAKQHEATARYRRIPEDGSIVDHVAHLIARKAFCEQSAKA